MNREDLFQPPTFFHPSHCSNSLLAEYGPVTSGADDSSSVYVHMIVNTEDTNFFQFITLEKPDMVYCYFTYRCES